MQRSAPEPSLVDIMLPPPTDTIKITTAGQLFAIHWCQRILRNKIQSQKKKRRQFVAGQRQLNSPHSSTSSQNDTDCGALPPHPPTWEIKEDPINARLDVALYFIQLMLTCGIYADVVTLYRPCRCA